MKENTDLNYILDFVLCLIFAALMVAGAHIKTMLPVDHWQVTLSLQIFFAVLAGFVLGSLRSFLSVLLYLIIGLIGAPVFAYGGGPGYILKPTFGFLIGFVAAALVTGILWEKNKSHSVIAMALTSLAGVMSYYACGLLYYYLMIENLVGSDTRMTLSELLNIWFFPTIIPDYILCILAGLLSFALAPVLESIRQKNTI